MKVQYHCTLPDGATRVIAPLGMVTPHGGAAATEVIGGATQTLTEASTGQNVLLIKPEASELTIVWTHDLAHSGPYPDEMFEMRDTRFTRFADDLAAEAREVGGNLVGLARAKAIACATASRFTYGHPEARFNDGFDLVPALDCGLVEGSCVDINTYLIAALRASGLEAGYVTVFYFPAEKGGHCSDGHCWVVTRIDGQTQEWDIAHHLKMGTRDIQPGLNPKPGQRVACFHSMGLDFPDIGVVGIKALIEPLALQGDQIMRFEAPKIHLFADARASA